MKKILALVLVLAFAAVIVACGDGNISTTATEATSTTAATVTEDPNKKSEGVMTYAQYAAAAADDVVTIEAYVQATQAYSEQYGNTSLYLQDGEGAYFVYRYACTAEEAARFTVGTKVKVTGHKAVWSGEEEINPTEVVIEEGSYIAEAFDATSLLGIDDTSMLGTDDLIKHQNQKALFKGLTVKGMGEDGTSAFLYNWDGSGAKGSNCDLYVDVELNGQTYSFTVESSLCAEGTDVYTAVENLKVGDKIDVECFLYWYNGVNPHMTSVTVK